MAISHKCRTEAKIMMLLKDEAYQYECYKSFNWSMDTDTGEIIYYNFVIYKNKIPFAIIQIDERKNVNDKLIVSSIFAMIIAYARGLKIIRILADDIYFGTEWRPLLLKAIESERKIHWISRDANVYLAYKCLFESGLFL